MRRVFLCFLEEIEDSKKALRNYLTFIMQAMQCTSSGELQYFGAVKCTKTTSVCLHPFLPQSRQQFVAKVWTIFPAQIL